jgi:hypothetical protein
MKLDDICSSSLKLQTCKLCCFSLTAAFVVAAVLEDTSPVSLLPRNDDELWETFRMNRVETIRSFEEVAPKLEM